MEPINSLKSSTNDTAFYRIRKNSDITEDERMQLLANELNLAAKEIDNKKTQIRLKANFYHVINTLSSLLILICAAVSLGLEVASDCRSIPVIVLSSIIFVIEGTHKLFRWGPLGTLYKTANIQLNRISRQAREYMYFIDRYTPEQLVSLIMILRTHFDDIDLELFNLSMTGTSHFGSGYDVEPNKQLSEKIATPNNHTNSEMFSSPSLPKQVPSSPSVHIHFNKAVKSAPVLSQPSDKVIQSPNSIAISPSNGVIQSPNSVRVVIDSDSEEQLPVVINKDKND